MSKKSRLQGFRTDTTKVRDRASRMESGGIYWRPKTGNNRVRILPPWNEEGVFYLETALHYGFKDAEGGRAYPCLRKLGEAKCPTCQVVARFSEDNDPDIKKIVKQMKAKGVWFMNIIDRKSEIPEARIFGAGFKIASAVIGYFTDEEYGDLTDPEAGRDITIVREGTGIGTTYEVRPGAHPKPIGVEGWETMLHNLNTEAIREIIDGPTMLKMLEETYPELDLSGITVVKKGKTQVVVEEDEEEEETPRAKKPIRKVAKKVEPDDDEDDEGDDDD